MSEKDTKEKSNRGGAREGSGRKPGSKNKISKATVMTVLEKLYDQTGQVYEDLLIEDFIKARANNDVLAHKYHALLSNKLMPDLNSMEVTGVEELLDQKKAAFSEALKELSLKDIK